MIEKRESGSWNVTKECVGNAEDRVTVFITLNSGAKTDRVFLLMEWLFVTLAIQRFTKKEICRFIGKKNLKNYTEVVTGMSKLSELYKQAESLNDEIPAELAKKIRVYSEIMQVIGKYHAAAVNDYGEAYAKRKLIYAETIIHTEGTGLVKEANAEVAAYEYRLKEAKAEADKERWKNAKESTEEIINALKKQLETLQMEYRNAG